MGPHIIITIVNRECSDVISIYLDQSVSLRELHQITFKQYNFYEFHNNIFKRNVIQCIKILNIICGPTYYNNNRQQRVF